MKYYLQILEEFHQKLNELQQLEDELENNVRKWHWVGHVQKTIIGIIYGNQAPKMPIWEGREKNSLSFEFQQNQFRS